MIAGAVTSSPDDCAGPRPPSRIGIIPIATAAASRTRTVRSMLPATTPIHWPITAALCQRSRPHLAMGQMERQKLQLHRHALRAHDDIRRDIQTDGREVED